MNLNMLKNNKKKNNPKLARSAFNGNSLTGDMSIEESLGFKNKSIDIPLKTGVLMKYILYKKI